MRQRARVGGGRVNHQIFRSSNFIPADYFGDRQPFAIAQIVVACDQWGLNVFLQRSKFRCRVSLSIPLM